MTTYRAGLALLGVVFAVADGAGAGPENGLRFTVTPAAPGRQLVRTSVPLPAGFLPEGHGVAVSDGRREFPVAVRVLTWHPARGERPRSARRALVSLPYEFADRRPVALVLRPAAAPPEEERRSPVAVAVNGEDVTITRDGGRTLRVRLLAPPREGTGTPRAETVEANPYFRWRRIHLPDPQWPRVIEVREDALGGVLLQAHLRRDRPGDGYAPDFGWRLEAPAASGTLKVGGQSTPVGPAAVTHSFASGAGAELLLPNGGFGLQPVTAPFERRGSLEARRAEAGSLTATYWRCTASEKVPMQQAAWRRAGLWLAPASLAPLTATLEYPHRAEFDARLWDELYEVGRPGDLAGQPDLEAAARYHHDAAVHSQAVGDDWGNVTGYADGRPHGTVHGMNRLNHAPALFEEAWRTGDRRLREVALLWCDNFHDLSVWWGPGKTGGARYNNVRAQGRTPPDNNDAFMWRSDDAVHFCTKGYAAFLLAYEETGDPRLREALEAQVRYAAQYVHADRGEARNVGDVDDFVRLYRYTGEEKYLGEALRLFRELRARLSPGDLFSQSGHPIVADPPFINDDDTGYRHPFAKPYILGYALLGLPRLARHAGSEPKLRDVVRAVADFLADSQDPLGGWRYPHPRSASVLLQQAPEHAWQLAEADHLLGPSAGHLDAIERVLRQRLLGWKKTGRTLGTLGGWEFAAGKARRPADLGGLYARPADRDFRRDYAEGQLALGGGSPEGVIYFPPALAFYLRHRPAARLLAPPRDEEPLGQVLARLKGERQ